MVVRKTPNVLRDWTEDEGTPLARRALVSTGPCGNFVAYVGVPADNSLAGRDYDDMPLDVHGGLTFAAEGGRRIWPAGWYWYGWDYAHAGDVIPGIRSFDEHDKAWTVEEVEAEARQGLCTKIPSRGAIFVQAGEFSCKCLVRIRGSWAGNGQSVISACPVEESYSPSLGISGRYQGCNSHM
jgi:hypothetical protein